MKIEIKYDDLTELWIYTIDSKEICKGRTLQQASKKFSNYCKGQKL